jgi:hypothetical protein
VRSILRILAFTWLGLASSATAAHLDQLLVVKDGAIAVGSFDFGSNQGSVARIPFRQIFGSSAGFPYQSNPGWNAVTSGLPSGYVPLPGNVDVAFDIVLDGPIGRNLSFWNGSTPVSWSPPTNAKLLIQKQTGPATYLTAIADGGTSPVAGFVVTRTTSSGYVHQHLDYFLLDGSNGPNPPSGVYVVALRNRIEGLASAESSYIVFGKGVSQASLDEAATWVDKNLVPDCTDRADNDGDGKVDFGTGAPNDPGCGGTSAGYIENPQCSDGVDNDNDGRVDFPADPDCRAASGSGEAASACGLLGIEIVAVPVFGSWMRRRVRAAPRGGNPMRSAGTPR